MITRGGERGAGGGLGGAGGGKGIAGKEEGGGSLLAPRPLSSLSSTTKKKRKWWERTSADDDDDSGGGGRGVVVGVGVGVVPPERRPLRCPLFLLLPGRVGRRGRGGGLETAAMRTPAVARTKAKLWGGGVMRWQGSRNRRRLCRRRLRRSGNGGRGRPRTTTTTMTAAADVSSSALAWEWSLQNVVLGVVLFFCSCCQGGREREREGGDWRLRRCARLLVQQNNF